MTLLFTEVSRDFDLVFENPSSSAFVTFPWETIPVMTEVSVCFWVRTNQMMGFGTVFSYSVQQSEFETQRVNELSLADMNGLKVGSTDLYITMVTIFFPRMQMIFLFHYSYLTLSFFKCFFFFSGYIIVFIFLRRLWIWKKRTFQICFWFLKKKVLGTPRHGAGYLIYLHLFTVFIYKWMGSWKHEEDDYQWVNEEWMNEWFITIFIPGDH